MGIKESVMEPVLSPLPKFDLYRFDAISAPKRGERYLSFTNLGLHFLELLQQYLPG